MKPLESEIPQPDETDEYGLHACALMRKMATMGVGAALDAELAQPSWDDPQWCRLIVRLVADRSCRIRLRSWMGVGRLKPDGSCRTVSVARFLTGT